MLMRSWTRIVRLRTCAGCTDPEALNYDSSATVDDGSCVNDPVPAAECVTSVEFDSHTT